MSTYPLVNHDSEQLLSVDNLPSIESKTGRLIRLSNEELISQQQMVPLLQGPKLVAFGANFDGSKLYSVLLAIASSADLAICHYQPCDNMNPCAVITGIGELEKSLLADLSDALSIELAIVDQAPALVRAGILVMDMDSTAIKIECIDEIAALAGVGDEVAAVTKRAMQGELDFAESLHHRVATLKDCEEGVLQQVVSDLPLMDGLENLVTQLQKHNWKVAIASGGFTYFTEHLKQRLNLTATFANVLEIKDGKLTGKVLGDVVDAQVKAQCVQKLAVEHNIDAKQTVAIGDGANDLAMLAKAQLGVAFHAKPVVRAKAQVAVNMGPLDQLLYLLLPDMA